LILFYHKNITEAKKKVFPTDSESMSNPLFMGILLRKRSIIFLSRAWMNFADSTAA